VSTNSRYLRDVRHFDKFYYALHSELFYEPLEIYYVGSQEYAEIIRELLRDCEKEWSLARNGFWFYVHSKRYELPSQGWKIHVSATVTNADSILKKAARVALANNVSFKFAADKRILSIISGKSWNRGGSGKFITMYPRDLESFQGVLEQLYSELREECGPYVLSDNRYRDCRVLYYRYGGFASLSQVDITGMATPMLASPDGNLIPDIRTPYFSPPSWVSDPFPAAEQDEQENALDFGKYRIKKALAFTNTGGVYLAENRDTGVEVVIKEARAHTATDSYGSDAITRLQKEQNILELLKDTGITPKPLGSFYEWENFFLVEEFVDGIGVRDLMLTESPLLCVRPSRADAIRFYGVFRDTFRAFLQVIDLLHQRGLVLGDLSATNIKIDPATCAVRLIDMEAAFRLGIDEPTSLFTPGFKRTTGLRNKTHSFTDDLYSAAAIMLYAIFPMAALSSLRNDLYDTVLRTVLRDMGWSQTKVFDAIHGLSNCSIDCRQAMDLLESDPPILEPHYEDDVEPDLGHKVSQELGTFLLAHMRPNDRYCLFPGDPFMHRTNHLSLGFGACGVLYTLKKCGFEIPQNAYDWLTRELDTVKEAQLPPGLMTGCAGIAWCLSGLGLDQEASRFMAMANHSRLLTSHHSYFYGMSGIGMANLWFYLRTNAPEYLSMALDLGDSLLRSAKEDEKGLYWENDGLIHVGYGYGQSGAALFLLRLAQLSGKQRYSSEGERALKYDLFHGFDREGGILSFPRAPFHDTVVAYLEEGSAGVARVAMRYGIWDQMEEVLSDLHRKYAIFAGLQYGLAGLVEVLTDAFLVSKDRRFLDMAKRPIAGIRDLYLIKQPCGAATTGDGLFRVSCDYATGVAGVMAALHRFAHHSEADFVLDEVVQDGKATRSRITAA
jgi:serine/threonine protein kinase